MPNIILELTQNELAWLVNKARQQQVPVTVIVRSAIRSYRINQESEGAHQSTLAQMLKRTTGIWQQGDGLE